MTLSDFATLSTAISGIAVTASLIYLARQTHQNTKHTRAAINQGRAALIAEVALKGSDADIAEAHIIAMGGQPTAEAIRRIQFANWATASIIGWQDSFSQHERGLLDDDMYVQMHRVIVRTMSQPAYRRVWTILRSPDTKFAAFMDGIIATLPPVDAAPGDNRSKE